MAISHFDKRLLIEQIRYLEAEQVLADETEPDSLLHHSASTHHDTFEDKLYHRATKLIQRHDLSSILGRAARVTRVANILLLLMAALLGALGASSAMNATHTINIYWLLLVLLGFNFISMLLWLVAINLRRKGLWANAMTRFLRWLPSVIEHKGKTSKIIRQAVFNAYCREADNAWFKYHFTGAIGRWRLSKMAHQFWLVYLFSGLIFLMLVLSVRQYDFVWGTTLLSDSAFIKLTEVLSAPLQTVGFSPPSMQQIEETRIGSTQILSELHRYHWAQFLLGVLLCFGLLPRLVLWLYSTVKQAHVRRQWQLDYYLPYYINLRQRFMPFASHGQIVDADTSAPTKKGSSIQATLGKFGHTKAEIQRLPSDTKWVAVELGDALNWPPLFVSAESDLGQVTDRISQNNILQTLQAQTLSSIAVAVSAARTPDRGVQRSIANLMANSNQRWLVLLKKHESDVVPASRLAQWYQLAQRCDVPADHVISMSEDES